MNNCQPQLRPLAIEFLIGATACIITFALPPVDVFRLFALSVFDVLSLPTLE
jgi:hypothetical protein